MRNFGLCVFALGAVLSGGWLVSACGSSNECSASATCPDGGSDTGKRMDAGTDVAKTETGGGDAGGGPITGLITEKWTWVPIAGAKCRDGSPTGIGVNLNPASDKLMIFLEGGDACFNVESCDDGTLSSWSETDFNDLVTTTFQPTGFNFSANVGIMDRTNAENPVQDWSYVYIPYCTGDLHAGNNVATVAGVTEPDGGAIQQHFLGYPNMGFYLGRIVPTFPKVSEVLLAGMSAGGFGAALNYGQVAKAFGTIPVMMLDDSGPPFEAPTLPVCLSNLFRNVWGLDKTVGAECGSDCGNASSFFLDYFKHIVTMYPNANFGLSDSTSDGTISAFLGFGGNGGDCTGYKAIDAGVYASGLTDIRTQVASSDFGEFLFPGTKHTSTQGSTFYTQTAGGDAGADGGGEGGVGLPMTTWVTGIVSGKVVNAGP
jgi:pectinacetylesterase